MTKPLHTAEAQFLCRSRANKATLLIPFLLLNILLISITHDHTWIALLSVLLITNLGVALVYRLIAYALIKPLRQMQAALQQHSTIGARQLTTGLNLTRLVQDIHRLSEAAHDYYTQNYLRARELEEVRQSMQSLIEQHTLLMNVTERESRQHYQSVMTYAHHLEERIIAKQADASLRFEFDDTCESSFALALITNALFQLNSNASCTYVEVPLAQMLQNTLLKLSAALDRRNMRLDSYHVDTTTIAHADIHLVQLAVWVMLLGAVRYAQDESILKLRTLTSSDGKSAILSIIISELSPGVMTEDERADYLERMLHHTSPHLFAQAIQNHANIVLANALLNRTGGGAVVSPLTSMSCEIAITLPCQ